MFLNKLMLIDFIVLGVIYLLFFYKRWKKLDYQSYVLHNIFYVYISVVIYLTLMPVITSIPKIFFQPLFTMHLNAFSDVIDSNGDAIFQVIINIIMFIPFGILLPILMKKPNIFKVTLCAFLFTLTIEVLQPLLNSWRISDITDVITNTIGGIVGYFIYKIIVKKFLQSRKD